MNNEYGTKDMCIAAYLLMEGAKYKGLKRVDGNSFEFLFEDFDFCQKLTIGFINNGKASAFRLFQNRDVLMTEIKGAKGGFRSY